MPSGGYGLNQEDGDTLNRWFKERRSDPTVKAMTFEWLWAYCSARGAGATPDEAAKAAYIEWDL